jgi:hypothetical protein
LPSKDGAVAGGHTAEDPTGEIAAAWQRNSCRGPSTPRAVDAAARGALDRFYRWADGVEVAELSRLAHR